MIHCLISLALMIKDVKAEINIHMDFSIGCMDLKFENNVSREEKNVTNKK